MNSNKDYDEDFYDLMDNSIHENCEEIYITYGDEIWEVVDFVCEYCRTPLLHNDFQNYNLNFNDEDELREQVQEIIFSDNDVLDVVLKNYIEMNY
jgi:hypothetical protein